MYGSDNAIVVLLIDASGSATHPGAAALTTSTRKTSSRAFKASASTACHSTSYIPERSSPPKLARDIFVTALPSQKNELFHRPGANIYALISRKMYETDETGNRKININGIIPITLPSTELNSRVVIYLFLNRYTLKIAAII